MGDHKLIFLPGAGGRADFWQPMSTGLRGIGQHILMEWPGLGDVPAQPAIQDMSDLVNLTMLQMDAPCALIAQSLGGVIAMKAALMRPEVVTHFVLSVTSGGIALDDLDAEDWRPAYFKAYPDAPRWLAQATEDLAESITSLDIPTLLIWGDQDPISPVAAGYRLQSLLKSSRLHVVQGGQHNLANAHAAELAPLVAQHLYWPASQTNSSAHLFERLQALGAGEFQHLNGTLEAHLLGTQALLNAWDAPAHVRTAGLFHAAYGTAGFDAAMIDTAQRSQIAQLIGAQAERLVYLYCCCDRHRYYPTIDTPAATQLPNRWLNTMEVLSDRDVRDLCELTAANELDIAIHSPSFREKHGAALIELFERMGTNLSTAALQMAMQVLPRRC